MKHENVAIKDKSAAMKDESATMRAGQFYFYPSASVILMVLGLAAARGY